MSDKKCLLITGTIIPNSNFVAQNDPEKRKLEYLEALKFYRQQFNNPIFFLENSAFDFNQDDNFNASLKSLEIKLIKFPPSVEFNKGKGYQEFCMLDEVIEQIKDEFDSFVKITGRQIIINIRQLSNQKVDGILIDRYKSLQVALTNVFCCKISFYNKYIKGIYKKVNDENLHYIEKVLYEKLKGNKQTNLFFHSPKLVGVSGSTGHSLQGNPLKFRIRNFERKFLKTIGVEYFPYKY